MFKFTDYDFVKALATAKYKNDKIRIQAIMLRTEGWECAAIAEEVGCHEDSVSKWWSAAQHRGLDAVCQSSKRGRPAIVSENLQQVFRSLTFLTQSYLSPYRGEKLRLRLEKQGIVMSLSTVYQTLNRLNFSYQTTRPFNPKRNESHISKWKIEFPSKLRELQSLHEERTIKVFFQDEARFGQKGTKCKQWALKGERPSRPCQDEFENGYIFGAVEPNSGQHHFLVTTEVCKEFMQHFLNSFSRTLGRGVHAMLVLDNAGWHTTARLTVPSNVSLHFLPSYSPDLNPVENLWDFMKDNFLCNRVMKGGREIIRVGVDACCKVTKEIVKSVCRRDYSTT
jgi:transposase